MENKRMILFVYIVHMLIMISFGYDFYPEDCDVLPDPGCECFMEVYNQPTINCRGLDLDHVPPIDESHDHTIIYRLDLSFNNLDPHLTNNTFPGLTVKELLITNNNPPLRNVDDNAFDGLTKHDMEYLNLKNNHLENIPNMEGMSNMKVLDLSHNSISRLSEQSHLGELSQLRALYLSNNPIQFVHVSYMLFPYSMETLAISLSDTVNIGHFSSFFGDQNTRTIGNLHTLTITGPGTLSNLQSIFIHLKEVQHLHLINCGITDEEIMLSSLYTVNIWDTLIGLDLSYNRLKDVPFLFISPLDELQSLNLEGNQITQLSWQTSYYMRDLQRLNLRNNNIRFVTSDAFNDSALNFLDLSQNSVKSLDENALPGDLTSGQVLLHILQNELICSCSVQWLLNVIGQQVETGIGPFTSYDMHQLTCTQYGQELYFINAYNDQINWCELF